MEEPEPPQPTPPLRRRNSIATPVPIPTKLTLHTSSLPPPHTNGTVPSPSPPDFELYSLKLSSSSPSSYTSLKDLLPSVAVNSPTAAAASSNGANGSAYEICIRNRLVKQAAWAYLQPMASSPDSSGHHFLHRLWLKFSTLRNPIKACVRFIEVHLIPGITEAFDKILRAIRVRVDR